VPNAHGHDERRRGAPPKDALTQGTALSDAGAVTFENTAAGAMRAVVVDAGERYEVAVSGDPAVPFSPMAWSCPCTPDGALCAHVVAVAVTLYRQQHAEVPRQRKSWRASG
jgi:uncharacterized Zn finger protein